jgi:hypothetical protein
MGNLLDMARDAAVSHDPAVPSQHAAELRRLIALILANDAQAERDWTLSVALADAENALVSFRALAERL